MADMYSKENRDSEWEVAQAIVELAKEHRGIDVSLLDLRGLSSWADYFIIATVTSNTHRTAIHKYVCEYARAKGYEIRNSGKKTSAEDTWMLVDLGSIVVHLMSAEARNFYELERLWARPE
jgi:ribosome-associated protein